MLKLYKEHILVKNKKLKKSQLRNIIKESIKQLMSEQPVGAKVTAKICNPTPNECQGTMSSGFHITICDGPGWGQNCSTPNVGDYFVSTAVGTGCGSGGGSAMGYYKTSWEVVQLDDFGPEDGKRMRYHQCDYDEPEQGCTDPTATNYDPIATIDDGSCTYTGNPITGHAPNDLTQVGVLAPDEPQKKWGVQACDCQQYISMGGTCNNLNIFSTSFPISIDGNPPAPGDTFQVPDSIDMYGGPTIYTIDKLHNPHHNCPGAGLPFAALDVGGSCDFNSATCPQQPREPDIQSKMTEPDDEITRMQKLANIDVDDMDLKKQRK